MIYITLHRRLNFEQHDHHQHISGVNLCALEVQAVPALLVAAVVFLLNDTNITYGNRFRNIGPLQNKLEQIRTEHRFYIDIITDITTRNYKCEHKSLFSVNGGNNFRYQNDQHVLIQQAPPPLSILVRQKKAFITTLRNNLCRNKICRHKWHFLPAIFVVKKSDGISNFGK